MPGDLKIEKNKQTNKKPKYSSNGLRNYGN